MKKRIFHIFFLLACMHAWSQNISIDSGIPSGETCRILTDRSIYVAGEDIRFSVFYRSPGGMDGPVWSKVFYTELISPGGIAYSRTKIKIDSAGTSGSLEIPGDLPSGTYYLKGYTRWMKNYGPASYTYLSVDVVNPVIKKVLQVDTLSEFTVHPIRDPELTGEPGSLVSDLPRETGKRTLQELELQTDRLSSPLECCVTVVPQGSLNAQWNLAQNTGHALPLRWKYVPETRGLSISGSVAEDSTGSAVPYAVVYISLMGEESGFLCNFADSAGRFFFTLPDLYMKHDLFISAHHDEVSNLRVNIDQDFSLEPVRLPSFPFRVSNRELALIQAMVVNAQIHEQYAPASSGNEAAGLQDEPYFYGEPSAVIHFDDFIKLPAMEEYFTEVIPQVSITRTRRIRSFLVQGTHPDLKHYAPLVMVDGVAVFDVEAVLAISPGYIERIEIVEAPYVRGNLTFGGIIHLISRRGDMGYIDLPSSGLLVNYSMYDKDKPGDPVFQPHNPRMPDVRNTLYWDPYLKISPGIPEKISFYTPDAAGYYQVVVRGFDGDGNLIARIFPFRVN